MQLLRGIEQGAGSLVDCQLPACILQHPMRPDVTEADAALEVNVNGVRVELEVRLPQIVQVLEEVK